MDRGACRSIALALVGSAFGCGMLLGIDPDSATFVAGDETPGPSSDGDAAPSHDASPLPSFACDAEPPPLETLCAGRCGVFADPCGGEDLDCGFDCSALGPNFVCAAESQTCECAPVPRELACQSALCGEVSNGCDGLYECPSQCGADEICDEGQCVCPPAPLCEPEACLPSSNRCGNTRECAFCGNLQCVEQRGVDGGVTGSYCGCDPGADRCGSPGDEFCCGSGEACYSCNDGRTGCYDPRGNPPAGCN